MRDVPVKNAFESAILSRGALYVHASPKALQDGLSLSRESQPIDLEPLADPGFEPNDIPFRKPFVFPDLGPPILETLPDGSEVHFGTEACVNALSEWALPSGQTLQMRIEGFTEPHFLDILSSVTLPATSQPRVFRALIASHRCEAELHVRFHSVPSDKTVNMVVPFEQDYDGGTTPEGYQAVCVPAPFADQEMLVSFGVRYIGHLGHTGGDDTAPYVFIANAEITGDPGTVPDVRARHRIVPDVEGGQWLKARVPLFASSRDAPLTLNLGGEAIDVFAPEDNTVTLVEDYGHTLMVRAQTAQDMMLFINGESAASVFVGEEETAIRLPASYLRGEIIDVSIRDVSGSQVFLSLPVLAPRSLTPHDVIVHESRAPFPTDLTVRANHRYQALRAHLADPGRHIDAGSLATALDGLDRTFDTIKLKPFSFPTVADPKVSVVIPAHNKVHVTYYALCALLLAHNKASFEVIVVDDASTDETRDLETIVSGITVVRHTEPQRFIRACNAGVAQARGDYVVLLNNDTEPTTGWLDALIDGFDRFDNVGAVGSKLLYPDGTLQDAGGIVWGSGNPWNYGNGANPWEPRFCYARQVDYLSGAALMTTRAIWQEVGGLSDYLEPMYFEDTDFSFKVREAGYATYFVPSSVVYHFEGVTSGTDTASGFKKYQEINRPKFKRRWSRAFAGFGKQGHQPDLEKDRGIVGRVLFIDYTTPREDRDAGSYAARREIELVQSLGYKVTFLPQNLAHMGSYTTEMERNGVEMIHAPFVLSVPEFLEQRVAEFDAIYITRYGVAQDSLDRIRALAPNARIILNNADLHFLRELRAAISTNDQSRMIAMRAVREQELAIMKKADVVLSYNEVEHSVIASHTDGQARVMTCPWVVAIPPRVAPLRSRKGLSFLGSFNHHPNVEGVMWFCDQVMPLLHGTDLKLSIYGSGMRDEIRALASDAIDPAGFVENLSDAYDRHRIFVAPLLSGAGIKGKVLSAIAHGIPTVLTPVAAEGIGLRSGHDCLIVETPDAWAEAIVRLSGDNKLWTAMSRSARSYAAERFSFAAGRDKMKAAFEAVDLFGSV